MRYLISGLNRFTRKGKYLGYMVGVLCGIYSGLAQAQVTAGTVPSDAEELGPGINTSLPPGATAGVPATGGLQQPSGFSSFGVPSTTGTPLNSANTQMYNQLSPIQNAPNITSSTSVPSTSTFGAAGTAGVNSGTFSGTDSPISNSTLAGPTNTTGVVGNTGQNPGSSVNNSTNPLNTTGSVGNTGQAAGTAGGCSSSSGTGSGYTGPAGGSGVTQIPLFGSVPGNY
jgi:collagen type VII alpha